MALKVDIVGGGIGGVALAAALNRLGLPFRLFEQAEELKAVGYGLTLQKNAIDALETVGIGREVASRGVAIHDGQIRQPSGRVLTTARVDLCAIHRATLLAALADHVPSSSIVLGTRIEQPTDGDVVVAADGLHSQFRPLVAPDEGPVRDSGYTAWRGLGARTPEMERHVGTGVVSETWGRGTRFGIVPVDGERIYWFAVAPVQPLRDRAGIRAFLLDTFRGWHEPVGALIRDTPVETVLESRIVDRLPIPRWHDGRVILLGDAAHPMTPNLGQGGCQAIEDAVVLAHLLRACDDGRLERQALAARYEAERRARVTAIVDQSFTIGRLASHSNRLVVAARDTLFRLLPARAQERRLRQIVTFPGVPTS